jgi:hypothetical protein
MLRNRDIKHTKKSWLWTILGLCSLSSVTMCTSGGAQPPPPPQLGRAEVNEWLACTECTNGELKKVLGLGNDAVRDLAQVFDATVFGKFLLSYTRLLEDQWRRQVVAAKEDPSLAPDLSKEQYVKIYAANLTVRYQSRATTALSRIATPEARKVLSDARTQVKDRRVQGLIDQALKTPIAK